MARNSKVLLLERLEDEVREIAWKWAGKKANGQLNEATCKWPRPVKEKYQRIEYTLREAQRCVCDCKGRKEKPTCEHLHARTHRLLMKRKIPAKFADRLATTVAQIAHAKSDDHSSE